MRIIDGKPVMEADKPVTPQSRRPTVNRAPRRIQRDARRRWRSNVSQGATRPASIFLAPT